MYYLGFVAQNVVNFGHFYMKKMTELTEYVYGYIYVSDKQQKFQIDHIYFYFCYSSAVSGLNRAVAACIKDACIKHTLNVHMSAGHLHMY